MKKKSLVLLMFVPFLVGCSKTSELYQDYAYNYVEFMKNYYTEQNGVDKLKVASTQDITLNKADAPNQYNASTYTTFNSLKGIKDEDKNEAINPWFGSETDNYASEYGRHNNLSNIDSSFAYGYLSKLYDGRVRCESKFQLSRVQIDKNGYSTFFPKKLEYYKYFAFCLRGATNYYEDEKKSPLKENCYVDINIKFYKHILNSENYDVVNFKFNNVYIPCDESGSTNIVSVYLRDGSNYFVDLIDTVAMSFTFNLKNSPTDCSDDINVEKDYHFAIMLYEVMFPQSIWK